MPRKAHRPLESDLKGTVLNICTVYRLHVVHFRPARTEHGWRTPVEGDGKGWPDLTIVGAGVIYRELKRDGEDPTVEQARWIQWLRDAGQDAGVWRTADLHSGRINTELRALRLPVPAKGIPR